jgi:hypothetical protein
MAPAIVSHLGDFCAHARAKELAKAKPKIRLSITSASPLFSSFGESFDCEADPRRIPS